MRKGLALARFRPCLPRVEATARELAGVRSADVLAAGWRTDPEMLRAALARPTSQRAS